MASFDINGYIDRFLGMLDEAFRGYGVKGGLPRRFGEAVRVTPRHNFVQFLCMDDGSIAKFDISSQSHLDLIYSDRMLRYADENGNIAESNNSQPSFVLWLLHQLDLQLGNRFIEVGAGTGWLSAVAGRLVGHEGQVTGLEVIGSLAEQGQSNISTIGLGNVTILQRDGTREWGEDTVYDRGFVTAATWDIPPAIRQLVVNGGLMIVPIALRGDHGCQVALLKRVGDSLDAIWTTSGWFVSLRGDGQDLSRGRRELDILLPGYEQRNPTSHYPFWLGATTQGVFGLPALEFRAFLGRTEPWFATARERPIDGYQLRINRLGVAFPSFGLVNEAASSAALCRPSALVCYGTPDAALRLTSAYRTWVGYGMPGATAYGLTVVPRPSQSLYEGIVWTEARASSNIIWRLSPNSASWCEIDAQS